MKKQKPTDVGRDPHDIHTFGDQLAFVKEELLAAIDWPPEAAFLVTFSPEEFTTDQPLLDPRLAACTPDDLALYTDLPTRDRLWLDRASHLFHLFMFGDNTGRIPDDDKPTDRIGKLLEFCAATTKDDLAGEGETTAAAKRNLMASFGNLTFDQLNVLAMAASRQRITDGVLRSAKAQALCGRLTIEKMQFALACVYGIASHDETSREKLSEGILTNSLRSSIGRLDRARRLHPVAYLAELQNLEATIKTASQRAKDGLKRRAGINLTRPPDTTPARDDHRVRMLYLKQMYGLTPSAIKRRLGFLPETIKDADNYVTKRLPEIEREVFHRPLAKQAPAILHSASAEFQILTKLVQELKERPGPK